MIVVENLSKIYKSNYKKDVIALDDVSFKLPNKGIAFIYGKSGSGKSTLLNLMASFDDPTNGKVILDGNNLNELDGKTQNEYRNSMIGFIFQDYYLIHNLTVKENIALSLNLINETDDGKIEEMLKKVGLSGYENRYPKELSGGECQRVAIARCLIKNPKYIFADEPTGNLDSHNAAQILELLKEFSKERLVLIISHDVTNAYKYGDRIIELSNGKIVKDIEKHNTKEIEDNTIYIPDYTSLSDKELEEINQKIATGKYVLSQESKKFKPTNEIIDDTKIEVKKNNKTKFSTLLNLAKIFTRKNLSLYIVNGIVLTLLLIIIFISQMFSNFDSAEFIIEQTKDNIEVAFMKNFDVQHIVHPITESDIQQFYDLGYSGKVYKLYTSPNPTIIRKDPIPGDSYAIAVNSNFYFDLYEDTLSIGGRGVLECDLEYLTNLYGKNGKLEVLAGSLDSNKNGGVIITDYYADCIRYHRDMTYDEIVATDYIEMDVFRYRVSAIIDTDYKTRYKEEISKLEDILTTKDKNRREEKIEALQSDKMMLSIDKELNNFLSICYYIGDDYESTIKNDTLLSGSMYSIVPTFEVPGKEKMKDLTVYAYVRDETLKPGEIKISKDLYELLFETEEYDENTFPLTMKMTEDMRINQFSGHRHFDKELTIVGIDESRKTSIWFSHDDYYELYEFSLLPYCLYFENSESAIKVFTKNNLNYYMRDNLFIALTSAFKLMDILKTIFSIITVFLYALLIVLLISFGSRIIKRKIHEIGILKALGAKMKDVYIIIIVQILIMLLGIVLISTLFMLIFDGNINHILVDCFHQFMRYNVLGEITIIKYKLINTIIGFIIMFVLTMICSTYLMLSLKKVKPINIIKKENE